jgi:transposase
MNGRGFITITMSMREVDRLRTIQSVVDGMLMTWQAAERLHLGRRQVERLTVRYRSQGASGLLSRHRGHPSNYRLADGVAERALNLIRDRYPDFGPTLACEKLRECHGLALSKETVRHLMTDAGLWIPRRQPPSLVRGTGAGVHVAGVCRRCEQPADGAAFHGHRVDLQLL